MYAASGCEADDAIAIHPIEAASAVASIYSFSVHTWIEFALSAAGKADNMAKSRISDLLEINLRITSERVIGVEKIE
jgi:hypothetical protein